MDFRRIEMIFLIVFVGLNIFLGMSFFQSQQVDLATASSGTSEVVADIKRDQIKLPKLSTKTPTGGYLASVGTVSLAGEANQLQHQFTRFATADYTTMTSTLDTTVTVRRASAVTTLTKWLQNAKNVLHGDEYVYAEGLSGTDSYVFAQRVAGRVIYDPRAQITFTVANGRLTGYTQTYLKSLDVLRADVALCSAQDAVVTLYRENEIPNSATVRWTQLAYTYLLDAKGATVYIPAWFVGVESQGSKNVTVKKVNAINKTVLKARE
ncbi:two-component system regulatory protein YycI [Lacticaseibacillus daqingensis]|uniref:two-component system regulatory protein YycI n=1 Tax=Lacticaseibacillus daqingensis TaxID=2486014 RepID=UPI000F7757E6|nr:two-component system regulatory protein YycI [Lacticaseibacillus daqingensis]